MAMLLDSHVVDRGSSPRPDGLNSRQVRVHACPRSREESGEEGIVAWPTPQGVISHFLSFWQAHTPYSKILSKRKKRKRDFCYRVHVLARETESKKSPPRGMAMLQFLLLHSPLGILGMHAHAPGVSLSYQVRDLNCGRLHRSLAM